MSAPTAREPKTTTPTAAGSARARSSKRAYSASGSARSGAGDDPVGEVTGRWVLQDQLVPAVGQDLALDHHLALVRFRRPGDPGRRAAPPVQLDRRPRPGLRRRV